MNCTIMSLASLSLVDAVTSELPHTVLFLYREFSVTLTPNVGG